MNITIITGSKENATLWTLEVSKEKFEKFVELHQNDGCSTTGTLESVLEDFVKLNGLSQKKYSLVCVNNEMIYRPIYANDKKELYEAIETIIQEECKNFCEASDKSVSCQLCKEAEGIYCPYKEANHSEERHNLLSVSTEDFKLEFEIFENN